MTITPSAAMTWNGQYFGRANRVISIAAGALTVNLVPNSAAFPAGTYYTVQFDAGSRGRWTEYWYVPEASVPLRLSQVRIAGPPAPGSIAGSTGTTQYVIRVTDLSSVTVSGVQHGLGANVLVTCTTESGGFMMPGAITVDPATAAVQILFAAPARAVCTIRGGSTYSKSFAAQATLSLPASEHLVGPVTGAAVYDEGGRLVHTGPVTLTPATIQRGGVTVNTSDVMAELAAAAAVRVVVVGG